MIKELLQELGGSVIITDKIRCKLSPHKPSEVITGKIDMETDFSVYSKEMQQTIIQRLKLLIYESNKNKPAS